MAVDETISEFCRHRVSPPTLRFYTWNRPSLTIGYFQSPDQEIDLSLLRKMSVPVIRRITGGRAVFHSKDLCYSLSAPLPSGVLPGGLRDSYQAISRALVKGLGAFGLPLQEVRSPPSKTARSSLCFATRTRHEITCEGYKILGSAQHRWRDGMIQQGSLLLDFNPEKDCAFFQIGKGNHGDRIMDEAKRRFAGIGRWLPTAPDPRTLWGPMASAFEKTLGIHLKPALLSRAERDRADHLMNEKYFRDSWNLARTA